MRRFSIIPKEINHSFSERKRFALEAITENIYRWIGKVHEPQLTPVEDHRGDHFEADQLIILEQFHEGKRQQRQEVRLAEDRRPMGQGGENPTREKGNLPNTV